MLQKGSGTYSLGYFTSDQLSSVMEAEPEAEEKEKEKEEEEGKEEGLDDMSDKGDDNTSSNQEPSEPSELNEALNEFIAVFAQTVSSKRAKAEPLIDLKLKFIDFAEIYPQLDPYNHLCEIENDGTVTIAEEISEEDAAEGIIDCAWMVIEDNKLHKKFRAGLQGMEHQEVFQAQGLELER